MGHLADVVAQEHFFKLVSADRVLIIDNLLANGWQPAMLEFVDTDEA